MNTQTTLQTLAASYAKALVTYNECVIRNERDKLNKQLMMAKYDAYGLLCAAEDALKFEAQFIALLNLV